MLLVSSATLTKAAQTIRERKKPQPILGEDVTVTSVQMETAARLLREADPSICNGNVAERPGFIEANLQHNPGVLVFVVGILPTTHYAIDRRGAVEQIGRSVGVDT